MTDDGLSVDYDAGAPLWLRWWHFKAWFHRCPECKHRPDRHYGSTAPRWEDDKIAAMLGIGQYGCRRCGHGSIAERGAGCTPDDHNSPRCTCPLPPVKGDQ